jgi:guanine deaminase
MDTIRLIILCAAVFFGAYAQHSAWRDVKLKKATNKKLRMVKSQISALDVDFMKRAIDLSYVSIENSGAPFGSVVVRSGNILGEGWDKTNILKDPTAHAEMEAIRDACKRTSSEKLQGSVIFSSSQPCQMCLSLMYLAGIEKVFYCIPGGMINDLNDPVSFDHVYEASGSPQFDMSVPQYPMMEQEAGAIIKSYENLENAPAL